MLIPGDLKQVPKSMVWEDIIIEESKWFDANEDAMYKALNYTFVKGEETRARAKNLMNKNRQKFTLNKMTEKLDEIVQKHMKDVPQQVGLNLPKLKKVDKETPKVNLPKLKKVTEVV